MRYLRITGAAATVLAALAVSPAAALEIGLGGLGSVSVGRDSGGGIGASANIGGPGGVSAGASLGGGGASAGASVGGSGGVSAGASVGGASSSTASVGASLGGPAGGSVGATVGGTSTASIDVGVGGQDGVGAGLSLGGVEAPGRGGVTGDPLLGNIASLPPSAVRYTVQSLGIEDVARLKISCRDVLGNPGGFSAEAVMVCRLVAAL